MKQRKYNRPNIVSERIARVEYYCFLNQRYWFISPIDYRDREIRQEDYVKLIKSMLKKLTYYDPIP
jgi:hypothetical protein